MPKATRANEGVTPKKRTRKTNPENGNVVHAEQPVTTSAESVHELQASPELQERIRVRAYELYLQRGGKGGSPDQDWLRAKEEICGKQRVS